MLTDDRKQVKLYLRPQTHAYMKHVQDREGFSMSNLVDALVHNASKTMNKRKLHEIMDAAPKPKKLPRALKPKLAKKPIKRIVKD